MLAVQMPSTLQEFCLANFREFTSLLKNSFTSSFDAHLGAESANFGRFELG